MKNENRMGWPYRGSLNKKDLLQFLGNYSGNIAMFFKECYCYAMVT